MRAAVLGDRERPPLRLPVVHDRLFLLIMGEMRKSVGGEISFGRFKNLLNIAFWRRDFVSFHHSTRQSVVSVVFSCA